MWQNLCIKKNKNFKPLVTEKSHEHKVEVLWKPGGKKRFLEQFKRKFLPNKPSNQKLFRLYEARVHAGQEGIRSEEFKGNVSAIRIKNPITNRFRIDRRVRDTTFIVDREKYAQRNLLAGSRTIGSKTMRKRERLLVNVSRKPD